MQNEDIVTAQETAGFHEIELRHAIGSHFNHLFFLSILSPEDSIKMKEPAGKVGFHLSLIIGSSLSS